MATDFEPILKRVEELAIAAGMQLVKPPYVRVSRDELVVPTIDGEVWFDVDVFIVPDWEPIVARELREVQHYLPPGDVRIGF